MVPVGRLSQNKWCLGAKGTGREEGRECVDHQKQRKTRSSQPESHVNDRAHSGLIVGGPWIPGYDGRHDPGAARWAVALAAQAGCCVRAPALALLLESTIHLEAQVREASSASAAVVRAGAAPRPPKATLTASAATGRPFGQKRRR